MNAGLTADRKKEEESVESSPSAATSRLSARSAKTALTAGAILLVLLLVAGIVPRLKRHSELSAIAKDQEQALLIVNLVTPHLADPTSELILPATTQAIQETTIYARTSGYVRRWLAGMGEHVRVGQLLAEIATPEMDQQLREARQQTAEADQNVMQSRAELAQAQAGLEQAEAALKQARTNLELARVNLERSKTLVAQGVVSRQDTDDKQAIFDARQADVEAAQATVRVRQATIKAQQSAIESKQSTLSARQANAERVADLQSFQKVTAPFSGIITARNLEVGMLVNSSGGLANNNGLYRVSRLDTIRVFINVPQTYAPAIHPGLQAEIEVKELPQKKFAGQVIGTSNSIDPASRTLLVEVRVPNPDERLLPGMYAQIKFSLLATRRAVVIPVSALAVGSEGTQVLILRPDQTVHYQKVEVGHDLGKEVEILSGLAGDESVIANPTDALREGTRVQAAKAYK